MEQIKTTYLKGDKVIWAVVFALSVISLLAVYSSTGTLAYKYQHGNTVYYLIRHSFLLAVGLFIIFVVHHLPYRIYSPLSQILLVLSVPLLLFTLVMGTTLNEASRWITLPGLGVTVQTSDFAKFALITYLARVLSLKQEVMDDFKQGFLPLIIPVVIICLLILPSNFSTAALLFATALLLMFVGRASIRYLLLLLLVFVVMLAIAVFFLMHTTSNSRVATWKHRVESFVNGDEEENFQAVQAKIAIATGGITGKGPGNSVQRNFLPHPYSDFIYAIIIEEYGLFGAIAVLSLYLFILFRAGVIVRKCNRTFPAFLTFGLAVMLVFQAMVNMAVAVNLLPVTGQTLPFLSMGGSSILFSGVALGIILSVSRQLDETETDNTILNTDSLQNTDEE